MLFDNQSSALESAGMATPAAFIMDCSNVFCAFMDACASASPVNSVDVAANASASVWKFALPLIFLASVKSPRPKALPLPVVTALLIFSPMVALYASSLNLLLMFSYSGSPSCFIFSNSSALLPENSCILFSILALSESVEFAINLSKA